jgi:ketosteroid isomerase-like protein
MPPSDLPSLLVAAGLFGSIAHAMPVPPPDRVELELRVTSHRFIGAAIDARGAGMEALTHPDFLLTDSDGSWRGRAEFLALMREQLAFASSPLEDVRVRQFGRVAVVGGVVVSANPGAAAARIRTTDVYLWLDSAWRLVSAQNTPLKPSTAQQPLRGTAPMHAAWQGQDPTGDDLAVLYALNENYVEAFRDADVAWYDAHLAPDYAVASGDGSLQDRAAALAHFSEPTFATSMDSFPVGRVNVRRFDDVALIHAENAYRLKDGREGVSRYTDIWHKQDGRWTCVAAHITVHKAPARPSAPA